ncbi:hypothetical protein JB92DRAFT_2833021 [Gautieria morchelliformis]|nr:hypothetical protein JB92DRAFT_2833021 [Gautieria morchelliformis]
MLPNPNLQVAHAHTLRSPPPTLACQFCPQHFRSKGGRTKHIQAKHPVDGLEIHGSNHSSPPSPSSSPSQDSSSHRSPPEQPPSPIPFEPMPVPTSDNMDVEYPSFVLDHTPPGSYVAFGEELNINSSPGGNARDQYTPDLPRITHAYHAKLNGQICNENGDDIPPDTLPPPRGSDQGPDDWTPYANRLEFEGYQLLMMTAGPSENRRYWTSVIHPMIYIGQKKTPHPWNTPRVKYVEHYPDAQHISIEFCNGFFALAKSTGDSERREVTGRFCQRKETITKFDGNVLCIWIMFHIFDCVYNQISSLPSPVTARGVPGRSNTVYSR